MPATFWAKVKTVVQAVAVGLALLPPVAESEPWVADTGLVAGRGPHPAHGRPVRGGGQPGHGVRRRAYLTGTDRGDG